MSEAAQTPAIQPRRPVRAADAARDDAPEWRARPDALPNLFADLFDEPPEAQDRIGQSRRRIERAIAAQEAARAPELLNLWHDAFDGAEALLPAAPVANDTPEPAPGDIDRLHQVRAALYTADPDCAAAEAAPTVQMRLAVHAMNGTLIAVAAPVGAAVMTYSLLRGEDLRLTARAMTLCGAVMTVIDLGMPWV